MCVASHLWGTPVIFISTDDESASGDEGMLPARRKRGLKSGMARTMDYIVTMKVIWPHKVLLTTQGQPPVYREMSLALFVNGYLTVLSEESEDNKPILLQHLQELMENSGIYGWKTVRDFHAAWLQQIEQRWSSWGDSEKKARLRKTLIL